MAIVYAVICVFDFVIVPSWYGITRSDDVMQIFTEKYDVPEDIQMELVRNNYSHHDPLTMRGGGMFHLAFGALLTGSAISRMPRRRKNQPSDS